MRKSKMTREEAKAKAIAAGIDFNADYFTTSIDEKTVLSELRCATGYRCNSARGRSENYSFFLSLQKVSAEKATQLPALSDWKCYYANGKQNSYDIEQDGVKYSITPILCRVTSRLLGYSATRFTQNNGHQTICPDGTIQALAYFSISQTLFARAASAAKVARQVHAKRNN